MAVLVCLADAGGEVLSRDEILDTVWPGMAVTDDVLTQSIVELRKAFGDDAHSPQFIETIPRVGIRLIPDIIPATQDSSDIQLSRWFKVAISFVAVAIVTWIAMEWRSDLRNPVVVVEKSPSIAVLPFETLSDATDDRYFAEGMSDEIRALLGQIPGLKVINRSSSHAVRNDTGDLRDIGNQLGVSWLLEGTVQRSGDRVRVHVQLIDATDGALAWSNPYDPIFAGTADLFAIQDDIAADVIDALEVHVVSAPSRVQPTDSLEAYTLFLKARAAIYAVDMKRAETLLFTALELDNEFAQAWELLAYIYWAGGGVNTNAIETQELVGDYASKSNDLDPSLQFAAAMVEMSKPGFDYHIGGIELFEAALQKAPNNSWLLEALVWMIMETGYVGETLALTEHYLVADPLSAHAHAYNIGALYSLGRTDQALARIERRKPTDAAVDIFQITMLGILLAEGIDDLAIDVFVSWVPEDSGFGREWFVDLVEGARDPESGAEFLDIGIRELVDALPAEVAFAWEQSLPSLYLFFGHIDRYYELILALNPNDRHWQHATNFVWQGTVFRRTGFTAHPRYLEVTEALGIHRVWEERGPPDFCRKLDEQWRCD